MPKIALIEYFTTAEKTFIFVIRPEDDEPIVYESEITEEQIKECRNRLLGNPEKNINGRLFTVDYRAGETADIDFFYQLSEHLIHPFLKDVKGYDILYLVPHSWLHYLPLHALKCKEGKYLTETYQIVYSPSATVIKYCQAKNSARQKETKNKTGRTCLALGVGKKDDSQSEHEAFHHEAQFITETIFKGSGICKTDLEASKEFLKENCKDKDVIHAACHGYFDPLQPLQSGLLLSNGSRSPLIKKRGPKLTQVPEDMILTAEEIFNLDLKADLVTLSACVTGVNDKKPGDELIGLTRALIYAGTPSVIVSLWPVDSSATMALMKAFYKYWNDPVNGLSKVAALQKAQKDLLESKDMKAPFSWAPFILVGDWL